MNAYSLKCLKRRLAELGCEESGNAASEYAILLSLLVLGSMTIIMSIGQSFQGLYTSIANALPAALG